MKINYNDLKFLVFFIPIYFLKLLNITAENKLLIGVSLVCFIFTVFGFAMKKAEMRTLCMLAVLLSFTALLVIVCGKQGAFFSAVMILALYDINIPIAGAIIHNILKILFLCMILNLKRNSKIIRIDIVSNPVLDPEYLYIT